MAELRRKNPKFVTIAHISDLHFDERTLLPPNSQNPELSALVKDIRSYQPDLICVTGDIADNPWRIVLKKGDKNSIGAQGDLENWNDTLVSTFIKSVEFLKHLCQESDVDPGLGLYVIPGNHDYRIQGIYSSGIFGYFQKREFKAATSEFANIFQPYCKTDTLCFHHEKDPTRLLLKIACLDSNDTDVFLNFATGAISIKELEKLYALGIDSALSDDCRRAVQFRICLVHHHPLPVVPAEPVRRAGAGASGVIQNMIQVLVGEQTNMFKNGGSFLFCCLENKIDLILHGHQHQSWFSNIQYPLRDSRRLLVAGAASAGKVVNGSYKYCVYKLEVSGNITVIERKSLPVHLSYEDSATFPVYDYPEMRIFRRRRLIDQLKGVDLPGKVFKYGIAKADEVTKVTKIREDGNTINMRFYKNLAPIGQAPISSIPIASQSRSGFSGHNVPPKITIVYDRDEHYEDIGWQDISNPSEGGLFGCLTFKPPLDVDHPVSIRIEHTICNAFEFIREYRRANTGVEMDSLEHSTFTLRAIYSDLYNEVILFPSQLGPVRKPILNVSGPGKDGGLDEAETSYCRDSLNAVLEPGVISISIKNPLPDFTYRVSWHLDSEDNIHKKLFSSDGLDEYLKIVSGALPDLLVRTKLNQILVDLKNEFSILHTGQTRPLIDEATSFSLMIASRTVTGFANSRVIDVTLKEYASLKSSGNPPSTGGQELKPGVGIGGQAFRSRQSILFASREDLGSEFYIKFENQRDVHSVLYCVPLSVRVPLKAGDPVYGVLCIGSFDKDTALHQIAGRQGAIQPIGYALTDLVKARFNKTIVDVLTGK